MKGIQFLTDENGKPTSVLIDLKTHGGLWEDFYDAVVANDRKHEPHESFEEVRKRLRKIGKI